MPFRANLNSKLCDCHVPPGLLLSKMVFATGGCSTLQPFSPADPSNDLTASIAATTRTKPSTSPIFIKIRKPIITHNGYRRELRWHKRGHRVLSWRKRGHRVLLLWRAFSRFLATTITRLSWLEDMHYRGWEFQYIQDMYLFLTPL